MSAIVLEGVTKRYGDVVALSDVTLHVERGTFLGLVGPNGSGKSTFLAVALGLTRPSEGRVTVDADVGIAFQEPNVYPDLTVAENVGVFARLAGGVDKKWLAEVRDRLGLDDVRDRPAGALSGGYRHRLDLALAAVKRPDVLLVDEPLADLDPVTRRDVREFLHTYGDDGNAVVVATHRLASFEPALDRVTVLRDGMVAFDGPLADMDEDLRDVYLAADETVRS